ncbi:hypothetical protein D3C75_842290 [compost metagenome]
MFNGFYDGSRYFLFGYQSAYYGAVHTSTNGTTWTMQTFKSQFVTQFFRYLNGKYFRLGNKGLQVSSDGSDWSFKWGGAYYEVIHDGSQYIAVGKEGNDGAIWTSADLSSWSKITLPVRSGIFTAAAYGNNKYVAIGEPSQTTTALATQNHPGTGDDDDCQSDEDHCPERPAPGKSCSRAAESVYGCRKCFSLGGKQRCRQY